MENNFLKERLQRLYARLHRSDPVQSSAEGDQIATFEDRTYIVRNRVPDKSRGLLVVGVRNRQSTFHTQPNE